MSSRELVVHNKAPSAIRRRGFVTQALQRRDLVVDLDP
jgi:hypothetical protein